MSDDLLKKVREDKGKKKVRDTENSRVSSSSSVMHPEVYPGNVTSEGRNLHESVASMDTSTSPTTYGVVLYNEFAERTGDLLTCQKALHREILKGKYPITRPFMKLSDYMSNKLFGTEKPTVDRIFQRELVIVKNLNQDLEAMLNNCWKYIHDMANFRSEIYDEAVESKGSLASLESDITKKTAEYEKLKAQFPNDNPLSEKAKKIDTELESKESEINTLYLQYLKSLDTVSDDVADIRMSKDFKNLFMANYFTYRRMCDRTRRIQRRLERFIGPYLMMYGLQQVGDDVYKQVTSVTQFSGELHKLATMKVSKAMKMLRSSITDAYDRTMGDTENALARARREDSINNQQLEERTRRDIEYLKR